LVQDKVIQLVAVAVEQLQEDCLQVLMHQELQEEREVMEQGQQFILILLHQLELLVQVDH
tara:strand:+ start:245 stop:424 length:180 start_codon:yes stop_codon:yes gene_type:complete